GGPVATASQNNAVVNNPDGNIRSVYAYRLDFLTALRMPGTSKSVVKYTPANIEIAGIDVTTEIVAGVPVPPQEPKVAATKIAYFEAANTLSGNAGSYEFTLN